MKLKHLIFAAAATMALSACSSDIDAFAKNAARHLCTNLKECEKRVYEDTYNGDRGRCRDETEANILAAGRECEQQGCTYDKDAASDCYKAIRKHKRDCNVGAAVFDQCNHVYTCPEASYCAYIGVGGYYEQYSGEYEGNPLIPACVQDTIDLNLGEQSDDTVEEAAAEIELPEFDEDAEAPVDAGAPG